MAWHKLTQVRKYLFEFGFTKEAISLLFQLSTDPWKRDSDNSSRSQAQVHTLLKTNAWNPVHVTGLDSDEEVFQRAWGRFCSPSPLSSLLWKHQQSLLASFRITVQEPKLSSLHCQKDTIFFLALALSPSCLHPIFSSSLSSWNWQI